MGENKINITSTAVEKGIDLAKSFLDKLILPAIEEVGLLAKDQVTRWRFNNQVKMLTRSKAYCEQQGIAPKTISLKLLCPLLEYSGLEEDEELQNKWAILLGNMVDSDQNIENHVFPYILSQISQNEFDITEKAAKDKWQRLAKLTVEYKNHKYETSDTEANLQTELNDLNEKLGGVFYYNLTGDDRAKALALRRKKEIANEQLKVIKETNLSFERRISRQQDIADNQLADYEIANLIRLGLIKEVRDPYVETQTLEIPNDQERSYLTVDFDLDFESEDSYILTELGDLFIKACTEKFLTK
jgi:hypothetical protein